jgi:MFS family permease
LTWRVVPERTATETNAPASDRSPRQLVREIVTTLSDRSIGLATVAVALLLFVFQGLTAFLPLYLQTKGLDQQTAALLFGLMFITGAVSQVAAGSAADRVGMKPVLIVVTAVGVVTPVVLTVTSGTAALAVVVAVLGSRMAVNPVTNAYVVGALPDRIEGPAWGFVRTAFFLVGATGSTFVGFFADAGQFDLAFLALAGLSAVALGCYALLPGEK